MDLKPRNFSAIQAINYIDDILNTPLPAVIPDGH